MLILTRRIQESIRIDDDVTVTVLAIKGNQVRLGIEAPRDVEVHREEIYFLEKNKKARQEREEFERKPKTFSSKISKIKTPETLENDVVIS